VDARQVGAGGLEAWADGVVQAVLGGEEADVALDAAGAVGHGSAGGEAGGAVEQEGALAGAGVAVEGGEPGQGDAAGPELAAKGKSS
jgi:hypothetical protein